jgi:hypothetical protein
LGFFEAGQRRGAHVSVPEIGSRAALFCFGGILGSYADLRREFEWGNLKLGFFEGLGVVPRRCIEEEGRLVFPPGVWGNLVVLLGGVLWTLLTHCEGICDL